MLDDDDQEDDSENNAEFRHDLTRGGASSGAHGATSRKKFPEKSNPAEKAPMGRMRIAEDPSGFVRLNCEALFKDRFKWSKVAGDFWRVDQI